AVRFLATSMSAPAHRPPSTFFTQSFWVNAVQPIFRKLIRQPPSAVHLAIPVMRVKARVDMSYPDWMALRRHRAPGPDAGACPEFPVFGVHSGYSEPYRPIGTPNAMVYIALSAAIAANLNVILKNLAALLVLVSLLALIVASALGTSNFGAALRHRG